MLSRLRFIRNLVDECEHLKMDLTRKRLSCENRKRIKKEIKENEEIIRLLKKQLDPFLEKMDDPDMRTFVQEYFFENKHARDADHSTVGAPDSLRRRTEHWCRTFWRF